MVDLDDSLEYFWQMYSLRNMLHVEGNDKIGASLSLMRSSPERKGGDVIL